MLDELYQDLILDHYRRPRNYGPLAGADRRVERTNPLCGDRIAVEVKIEGGRLAACRFYGHGCSISQASASLMTEQVHGKSIDEARALVARFRELLSGEASAKAAADLGELAALRAVAQFPVRLKCALLAWNALEAALGGQDDAKGVAKSETGSVFSDPARGL